MRTITHVHGLIHSLQQRGARILINTCTSCKRERVMTIAVNVKQIFHCTKRQNGCSPVRCNFPRDLEMNASSCGIIYPIERCKMSSDFHFDSTVSAIRVCVYVCVCCMGMCVRAHISACCYLFFHWHYN